MKSLVIVRAVLVAGLVAPLLSGCLAVPFVVAAVGAGGAYEGLKKGGEYDKARDEEAFSRATAVALNVSPDRVGVSDMHRGLKDTWTARVGSRDYSCTAYSSTLHDPACTRLAEAGN